MHKKLKIGIIVAVIVIFLTILFFVLNNHGVFFPLNKIISGTPDKTCKVDSDCMLKKTSCNTCSCREPVNKDWNLHCPFKNAWRADCLECQYPENYELKCTAHQCKMYWNDTNY